DLDTSAPQLRLEQGEGFIEEAGDADHLDGARSPAREIEKTVDDAGGAEGLLLDLPQDLVARIGRIELRDEHLRVRGNARERCIHLVGDAGGKEADRGEAILTMELLLELDLIGDVVERDHVAGGLPLARGERRARHVDHDPAAATVGERVAVEPANSSLLPVLPGRAREAAHQRKREDLAERAAE